MTAVAETVRKIKPQPGPQEQFLATPADIAIFGGAAGGGKTYALLMEAIRHVGTRGYFGVIFRRNATQIRNEGGLWDTSTEFYSSIGGAPRESTLKWFFPNATSIRFAHMEYEKDRLSWQGAQIPFIGFDELTHFTERQFWYMLSRNRTTCGVRPYIRATCNPDPDSFVAELISWWIDEDTGYPIEERSGVLRYFVRRGNVIEWGDTPEELADRFDDVDVAVDVKSLTFIASSVEDNQILMQKDPTYVGNLKAMAYVDRERLLRGNWKIREMAGTMFRREWIEIVDAAPADLRYVCRYWDRAATEKKPTNDPDFTAGCKAGISPKGVIYVEDLSHFRGEPPVVEKGIKNTASGDTTSVRIYLEQDPGGAGKMEVGYLIRQLAGYEVRAIRAVSDKIARAKPASAQAEAGNVKFVRAKWNKGMLDEMDSFPDVKHKDRVDALSGAVSMLLLGAEPRIRSL